MPAVAIHAPRELGAGPHRPFVYRLPATGPRPMHFSVAGLPSGLSLDPATGILSGTGLTTTERYGSPYRLTLRRSGA